MSKAAARRTDAVELSHNLLGQRLGRKGRDTRERIIAAAERVLAGPRDVPFSLSAVAREASLGMTTLYLYFSDLTELILAVLEPIMASAETIYVARLRHRWPDETLGEECLAFVVAFHSFWQRHSRILHLRNSYGAALDPRLYRQRTGSAVPLIRLLMAQMDADPDEHMTLKGGLATVLLTGIERVVTIVTDADFSLAVVDQPSSVTINMLHSQARLIELAVRDARHAGEDAGVTTAAVRAADGE